jgi:hypothetical protein
MTIKRILCFCLIPLFFSTLTVSRFQNPKKSDDLISLIQQTSGLKIHLNDIGWQWKEEDIKGTGEQGEITFSDTKWLMFLIHWGPIQVPEINVEYVKDRMLKMWGVPFEFSGKEGKTEISGHEAVWVEAYGTNKSFYTRFIIWNCPESGREFIADTNYNLQVKTPEEDFATEMRSAKTVRCHKDAPTESFSDLTKKIESKNYGFSFCIPDEWFMFDSPYYVPFPQYEGIRNQKMGSLLGLCSDQNISVTLKWYPLEESQEEEQVMGIQQEARRNLLQEMKSQKDVENFQNHGMENFKVDDLKVTRIWGTCDFKELDDQNANEFYTGKGIYQAARWNLANAKKKIVMILFTRQYRYGTAVSSPVRNMHDTFLKTIIQSMEKISL